MFAVLRSWLCPLSAAGTQSNSSGSITQGSSQGEDHASSHVRVAIELCIVACEAFIDTLYAPTFFTL